MRQYRSYTTIYLFIFTLLGGLLITGCESKKPSRAELNEVKQVMEKRQQAIHNKDIELYKQVIFSGYSDGGVNYDAIIADMQDKFDRYDKIEFTFQRSTVDMKMNSARMVGQVSYKGSGMDKPVYDQERTIFRKVDGKWQISAGIKVGLF